jgi:pullulanase/glycogen debranching enzyme
MRAITPTWFQGRRALAYAVSTTKKFSSILMPKVFSSRRGLTAGWPSSPGRNAGKAPLGVLPGPPVAFDWEEDLSPKPESDAIIYELHVKGFTKNSNSAVNLSRAGTYAGVIEKIPYLQELGITVVELMPIFQSDPQEGDF